MIKVDKIEQIRRAYHLEHKSMRQIARELHCSRHTIKKALASAAEGKYTLKEPRPAPVLGPYKARIKELLEQNDHLPGKHRLTGHRISQLVRAEGYRGSESSMLHYLWQLRRAKRQAKVYLPLEFEPGQDAQVDWGEAAVILAGQPITVQLFVIAAVLLPQTVCDGLSQPETGMFSDRSRGGLSFLWRAAAPVDL